MSPWHFVNVKYDETAEKRQLFRRVTVGLEERLRTTAERLTLLDLDSIGADHSGLAPLAIQDRHDEAFNVEKVQKDFFRTLCEIHKTSIVPDIQRGVADETEAKRLA